jgi:hypothetical protein
MGIAYIKFDIIKISFLNLYLFYVRLNGWMVGWLRWLNVKNPSLTLKGRVREGFLIIANY